MKYNITSITDYLEELTGCKTRCLAHEVALGDCWKSRARLTPEGKQR